MGIIHTMCLIILTFHSSLVQTPTLVSLSLPPNRKGKKSHQVQFILHIHSLWHCQTPRGQALKENWVLHPHQGLHFIIFIKILKTFFYSSLSELFLIRVGGGWNKNLQCLSFLLWVCSHWNYDKRSFPANSSQQQHGSQTSMWFLVVAQIVDVILVSDCSREHRPQYGFWLHHGTWTSIWFLFGTMDHGNLLRRLNLEKEPLFISFLAVAQSQGVCAMLWGSLSGSRTCKSSRLLYTLRVGIHG